MKFTFEGSVEEWRALCSNGCAVGVDGLVSYPRSTPYPPLTTEPEPVPPEDAPLTPRGEEAWAFFKDVTLHWVDGFEVEGAPQPDRLSLLQSMGSGRHTVSILKMAYLGGRGLQSLVHQALIEEGYQRIWLDQGTAIHPRTTNDWLDFVERVAGNMVQICHMGFPDMSGALDLSTAWRRRLTETTETSGVPK